MDESSSSHSRSLIGTPISVISEQTKWDDPVLVQYIFVFSNRYLIIYFKPCRYKKDAI